MIVLVEKGRPPILKEYILKRERRKVLKIVSLNHKSTSREQCFSAKSTSPVVKRGGEGKNVNTKDLTMQRTLDYLFTAWTKILSLIVQYCLQASYTS